MSKQHHSPALVNNQLSFESEERDVFEYAADADAENTQRAYSSDWKHFLKWCAKRNKCPLPCSANDLALYIRFCVEQLKLKTSTVERRLSAVSEAHKRTAHPTPTGEWAVRNTLKRLKREFGAPARAKKPIQVKELKQMLEMCPTTLTGKRDKALLLIGFAGAFRRSDLVNLDVEDISKGDEGIIVMIRKGKTDQERQGREIGIPFGHDPLTCPVRALSEWLEAARIISGALFRPMTKFERPRMDRLSDRSVAEIVKKYCSLAGLNEKNFAGHSLRSGFATSAAMAGSSEHSIQEQTGHASVLMVRRYVRKGNLFRENACSKIDI